MAFIVVKRQISRFATRGAQKSIGSGAPKVKLRWGGGGSTIKVMVNSCYVIIIMIKDQQFNKVKLWLIAIIILLEIRILDIKSNGKKVSGGYLLCWSQQSHD